MRYFSLVPSLVYLAFVLISLGLYLNHGYLIQIHTIKVLYAMGAIGILLHVFEMYATFTDSKVPLWYRRLILPIDTILLLCIVVLIPSGQMIALYFVLLFALFVGVTYGKIPSLIFSLILFFSIATVMFIQAEVNSAPLLLNVIITGSSFFIINALASIINNTFDDQRLENLKLQKLNAAILTSSPIGFMVTDELGTILVKNPVCDSIFRKLYPNNQGDSIDVATQVLPEIKTLEPGDRVGINIIRKISDMFIFLKAKAIELKFTDLSDKLMLYILEDRTEIEKAEMAKRQSEKLAAIGTLAAGIAHEIRNPLTGMSGALQLLELNLDSEESKKLAKIVFREIDRLNGLITEFLDFSKPDQAPPDEMINVSQVLEDSISVVKQDKRFPFFDRIKTEIKPHVKIVGYSDKLKQVFINILVNAAQALEPVEKKELTVKLDLGSDHVIITFIDTGIGMSEQTMQKIFEPFHTTKPKGTGLGMAIALKIIELHKGKIFVESQVGVGTKIELHFPKAENYGSISK